jgi:hypothetical protein
MQTSRRSIRHRKRLHVTIGSTPLFTTDVGAGGFSAEAMRVQPPGTAIAGTIRINGVDVVYEGQIAWAKAGAPYSSLRGRMGIRFLSIPAEVRRVLEGSDLASLA